MNIFSLGQLEIGWDEVIAAAGFWGELDDLFASIRRGLAMQKKAIEAGGGPTPTELQAAMTQFRYTHGLISGQEAQNWLSEWGLTVDEWLDYFRRDLLRQSEGNGRSDGDARPQATEQEVMNALRVEALCSGRFADWAGKLARQIAYAFKLGQCLERDETIERWMERVETVYRNGMAALLDPARVTKKIHDQRLDWTHFDCRYVWFPEERIAREAALCLLEDGMSLDEVAYEARSVVQQWAFYLDEIETPARPYFLAARAGEKLGPLKMMEGFPLFAVESKRLPTSDDPLIRERAEASIIKNILELEVNNRIRWFVRFSGRSTQ